MKMNLKYIGKIIFLLNFAFFWFACEKFDRSVSFEQIIVDNLMNINDVIVQGNDTILVCGGEENEKGMVYLSPNNGVTWQRVYENDNASLYCLYNLNDSVLYSGGNNFCYIQSTDNGQNWQPAVFPNKPWGTDSTLTIKSISYRAKRHGTFVAGDLYYSGIFANILPTEYSIIYNSYSSELAFVSECYNNFYIAGGNGVIFKKKMPEEEVEYFSIENDFFTSITTFNKEDFFVSGYNGGIYKINSSSMQVETLLKPNGMFGERLHFKNITAFFSETLVACGEDGVIYFSENKGFTWEKIEPFTNACLNKVIFTNNKFLFASENGSLFFSDLK